MEVKRAGKLYSWGSNESGQLGLDGSSVHSIPVSIPTPPDLKFVYVEANGSHTVAVTGTLFSWGLGSFGRLGHGDKQNRTSPTLIERINNVTRVGVGKWHCIVLNEMGRMFSWGYGKSGRLGLGDELSHYRAKPLYGYNRIHFVDCSASLSHSVAVADDGKVYSWGDGKNGKLGHGNEDSVFRPKIISSMPSDVVVTSVKAGDHHTLLNTEKGQVYSFGKGKHGRLGHGNETDLHIPTKIKLDCKVSSIAAGKSHSYALTGEIYVWGKGKHGVLGLGASKNDCFTPKLLPSEHTFVTVVTSDTCTAALTEQGVIFTWGSCSSGRLGHGFPEEICWRPTRISGVEHTIFTSLAIGHYHMVAVTGKPKELSPGQAFKSDLRKLLSMSEVSDITVQSKTTTVSLIRIRCPNLLYKTSFPELKISQSGAMNFLKYIYTGVLPGWDVTIEDILELWLSATVVRVPTLLHQCKILVDKLLDPDVALYVIRMAIQYDVKPIVEQAVEFISHERDSFVSKKADIIEMKQLLLTYDKSFYKTIDMIFSEDGIPKPTVRTWWTLKNQKIGKIAKNFEALLEAKDSCDFAICIRDKSSEEVIPCHKAILACRSSFFAAAFRVSMAESKTGLMCVPGPTEPHGITVGAMKDLLLYLYTGSTKHLNDPVHCLYILSVADFYGMDSTDHHALLIHCSYNMQSAISIESCLDFYQLSHQLGVPKIEEITVDFILKHYREVSEKLSYLPVHIFQRIQVEFNLRLLQKYGSF